MASIDSKIARLKSQAEFLERVKAKFPDVRLSGHFKLSASVNAIAEYVDIIWEASWPMARPYVLFEDEPIYSDKFSFCMTTDEGYEIEWREKMKAANINPNVIQKLYDITRQHGFREYHDTKISRQFYADVNYGFRRFGE